MTAEDDLAAGRNALKSGDWAGARDALERAVAAQETAVAVEELGTALWWLDEQDLTLEMRERAFRLYRASDDLRGAARLATALAIDYYDFRGDFAIATGWLQRAEHLLDELPTSDEHAWFHIYSGLKALMFDGDVPEAHRQRELAITIANEIGNVDVQMMSVALDGLILLREGKVTAAMVRMDEAMTAAVGGEMSDLPAIGNTCCFLIYACEAVADYDRAAQWCSKATAFCRRMGMDAFFAICRTYYATVLIWNGEWDDADTELSAALQQLEKNRPSYAKEGLAKLGELRRRQGRLEEAESLFMQADPHRLSLMGRAGLALDRRDPVPACDLLERQIRRIGEEDVAERAFALALMVEARLMAGETDQAAEYLEQLEGAVSMAGTQPLRATANAAQAALARAQGRLDKAKLHYEDAVDLFEMSNAEFDAARMRLELAAVMKELGRDSGAIEQAMLAQEVFKRLGSTLYAERAAAVIAGLGAGVTKASPQVSHLYHLTPRESDVLGLIAAGKTNQQIADALVLSVRTVERHISTIYEKLQVQGPAARASAAALALSPPTDT